MNARRVEITLSPDQWDRLEKAREDVPRAAWIKRAVERRLDVYDQQLEVREDVARALESVPGGAEESEHLPSDRSAAAPSRASVTADEFAAAAKASLGSRADSQFRSDTPVLTARDVLNRQRQQQMNAKRGKK